jgi:hypothetical protein
LVSSGDKQVALYSLGLAFAGLCIAIAALGVSLYAIGRSNKNSSAAILVSLYDSLRQAWDRFLKAEGDQRQYEFAELMNLLELACAIHSDRSLVGAPKQLIVNYLEDLLPVILKNQDAFQRIAGMRKGPETFKYISRFSMRGPTCPSSPTRVARRLRHRSIISIAPISF